MRTFIIPLVVLLLANTLAKSQLPPPPAKWADWSMRVSADQPGEMSAMDLLPRPAGRDGRIVCRDGHFFSGVHRVRFWGINIAFGANFPTHEKAEALAARFAGYGINAVRFHHMDNQPYPNGIFADGSLTTLSPEALDRLDYFIFQLKQKGIYADLNLHVSRNYNHYHNTADGQDGPRIDKMVDIFDPDLIAAQKQYAKDLLGHVNAYTKARYAEESAVGIVEINNENSLFMWGADQSLATLPDVYADELKRQWNHWLMAKYQTREKLQTAWQIGEEKFGDDLIRDGDFRTFEGGNRHDWVIEQHDTARMNVTFDHDGKGDGKPRGAVVDITAVDGTDWHLQLTYPGLKLKKGKNYTLLFSVKADHPTKIGVAVSQAHAPWQSVGLGVTLDAPEAGHLYNFPFNATMFPFTATMDEDDARLSFSLGRAVGRVYLPNVILWEGVRVGLTRDEDPEKGTVEMPARAMPPSSARRDDWYTFLQQTEEKYYAGMMDFLKTDIGVKCPITGTIGFGPMGTFSQTKMDFVDAHAYWQHPTFPRKQWDLSDWVIPNTPMVDQPQTAPLWALAGTRVAGKPFTVTEYQHPAPNDWQAECIPFISTFAALQDWDGVFLFAYSHSSDFDKDKISSFFDIEGNPTKMPLMPIGARLFLAIQPDTASSEVVALSYDQVLRGVPQYSGNQADFLSQVAGFKPNLYLNAPMAIRFDGQEQRSKETSRAQWTAHGTGTGRFSFCDSNAAVLVGFPGDSFPIDLPGSGVKIEALTTPFATLVIVPAEQGKKIVDCDRLLITAVARARNTDMAWNTNHNSVGKDWGKTPVQIEVVQARVSLPGRWRHAAALDEDGRPTIEELTEIQGNRTIIRLGGLPALCYEVTR